MPSILGGTLDKYMKWGLVFIPVRYKSKLPKFKAGESWRIYQTQKPTMDQYRDWFADPETNVAIVCGTISGNFVALDFDDPEKFLKWEEEYKQQTGQSIRELTPIVQSGGGGFHVWLKVRHLPQTVTKEKALELGLPCEVKSEGGLITAPPSVHENGHGYKFLKPDISRFL